MIGAISPLAELPGVQLVMLVSTDGVPIAVPGRHAQMDVADPGVDQEEAQQALGKEDQLAAIASGWLAEASHEVGALSWTEPKRVVLKATRGTLIMQRARGAVLLVILARGLDPEEIRLAMDGTARRIERGRGASSRTASSPQHPPGPLPNPKSAPTADLEKAEETGHRNNSSGN